MGVNKNPVNGRMFKSLTQISDHRQMSESRASDCRTTYLQISPKENLAALPLLRPRRYRRTVRHLLPIIKAPLESTLPGKPRY